MFIVLIVIGTLVFLYGGMAVLNILADILDGTRKIRVRRHKGAHRRPTTQRTEEWQLPSSWRLVRTRIS